jgi:hypothetical protein
VGLTGLVQAAALTAAMPEAAMATNLAIILVEASAVEDAYQGAGIKGE